MNNIAKEIFSNHYFVEMSARPIGVRVCTFKSGALCETLQVPLCCCSLLAEDEP